MKTLKALNLVTPQLTAKSLYRSKWQTPSHIIYLEELLLDIYKKGDKKLIINMPPRHGKSQFVTKIFPLWWLLNRPDERIIISAYNSTLSEYFGREILQMFKQIGPNYGIELNPSQKSKSEFATNYNGSISSVGVGGSLTGRGANLIIVDDPIKNDAQANSPTMRDSIYDWFISTLITRLEPNGSVVLVMTRWHEDDLAGRLLKNEKWDRLILPALAEDDDTLSRKKGEPLWKERYSKDKLHSIRQDIGNYWFSGLYQQAPAPADGGIFRRSDFRYCELTSNIAISSNFRTELSGLDCYFTCDLAISTSEKSDYTVVVIFALDKERNIIITDIVRERIIPSRHTEMIVELYNKHKPTLIGIETVQYQSSLFHSLNNIGLPVTQLIPKKDKVTRALPLAAKIESGKVYFNRAINCISEMENELLNFPNAKHDDIVDALAYAVEIAVLSSGNAPVGYSPNRTSLVSGF